MHPLAVIPAVTLLTAAWALPFKLPGFGVRKSDSAVPQDTIPPAWKPLSRLALENRFVFSMLPPLEPKPGLKLNGDPRRLRIEVDPDSGTIATQPELGDVPVGLPSHQSLELQSREIARATFRRQFAEQSVVGLRMAPSSGGIGESGLGGTGLSLKFPSPLPKRFQSFLGPGGPAITVSGSENIKLSGQSNWTNQQLGPLGRKNSLFPSLDMQQDLDIRLEGQLSDRIRINLLQNSGVQIPLANRLAINYKGDEDDLVQALDLGNTNLTLPGTQYVSYSGRNEGLFGVKSSLKMGPLDFTILASKQEGRSERASYAGGSAAQNQPLNDFDYLKGQYFFLYDPNAETPKLIAPTDIRVYLDEYGSDPNAGNKVRGHAFVDPVVAAGDTGVTGNFRLLNEGPDQDYELVDDFYGDFFKVIKLRTPVTGERTLAVTYVARDLIAGSTLNPTLGAPYNVGTVNPAPGDTVVMRILRAPQRVMKPDSAMIVNSPNDVIYDTTQVFTRTRELELKNLYQLSGQNIDLSSLKFVIARGFENPPDDYLTTPATGDTAIKYVEATGLDVFDETSGVAVPGHDGRIDGTRIDSNSRLWVDAETGVMFFYDLRPFAPRLDSRHPFEVALDRALNRRARLTGAPSSDNEANARIYDEYNPRRDNDSRYFMEAEFTAQRATGEISLGRSNIIEGSDVVTINGVALTRDRDYTIDYDLGRVVLKRQLGPSDNLNVNYSYAPLFQQAGRTLIGSAFKAEGRDRSLGGAFMYESKGATDLRPRLGEEPSRSLIGDLNTDLTFRPSWLTRMVDALPGVRTTAVSDFRVQAEVGASFPNPNTKGEVYVDDMEGVRDAISASMGRERWRLSSLPLKDVLGTETPLDSDHNAELKWYAPQSAVEEKELRPELTEGQGARNKRQVLALSIPRRPIRPAAPPADEPLWAGMTYPLDNVGLDLSRAQFIEVWVNDFNDFHHGTPIPRVRGRHVQLHIDLGTVSEDQQRAPDEPPNDKLDTEDVRPFDDQLDVSGNNYEDTGVDSLVSPNSEHPGAREVTIRDLTVANANDPEGDDFLEPDEDRIPGIDKQAFDIDPRKWRGSNGTENNKNIDPVPDTEDLNGSDVLETTNNYFEWTIDLGDSAQKYLITDVRRDFSAGANYPPALDNGWRRYRIPISDSLRTVFGFPDLTYTRHLRIWLDGILESEESVTEISEVRRPYLMLGGLDIVGSRWQNSDLTDAQRSLGTTMTLNSVNSIDNADVYVAPFDPGKTRSGNQELQRREQSIAMEFTRLAPDDTLEAFKTFSLEENYSRYGTLAWFNTAFEIEGFAPSTDALWSFVRFSSDEQGRNYYEYKTRVATSSGSGGSIHWQDVELALTTLSNLKLRPDFPVGSDVLYRAAGPSGNDSLIIKGRPSFTRLRRVSFGLINPDTGAGGGRTYNSGQLWFDELRAKDVAKDKGVAQRVAVGGNVANLFSYNVNWDGRDADFVTVGQSRGSGNSTDQLNAGGTFNPHRFFEATGILTPVNLSYTRNSARPRFTAGDDVVRTGGLAAASETRSESRSFSTSYQRSWSDRSNPWLRYTLGGITSAYRWSDNDNVSPSAVGTGSSSALDVSYGISPRSLWMPMIPGTKLRFAPLPERIYWNYTTTKNEAQNFQRTADGSGLIPSSFTSGRTAFVNFGGDFRPIDLFHHHFEAVRNLTLGDQNEKIGSINLGRVVTWRQNMDARYTLRGGPWLNPTLGWTSLYSQDNRPELSRDLSVRAIGNGQTMTMSWALPFDRLKGAPLMSDGMAVIPTPREMLPESLRAAADSARAHRPRVRFSFRDFVSRLGNLTTEASFNRSSSYSRLTGVPSFLYLVGVSDDPGLDPDSTGRMRQQFGNNVSLANDWRTSARTRVLLGFDATLQARGEFSGRRGELNAVVTRSIQSRFPDLEIDYGRVANVIRLDRFFTSPRLRTAYNRSQIKEYRNSEDTPTGVSTNSSWSPLISLDGDLKSRTRVGFKIERRITQRENFQLGHSIATERNTDVNLSLSRSYSKGQKVKVFLKETTVRTSVNLGLTGVYSRRSGETKVSGQAKPQFPVEEDRVSLNGTGSYSFSNNVTGSVALGFGQNRDIVRAAVSRNVRVELRAAFTF